MKTWTQKVTWFVVLLAVVGLLSSCHKAAQCDSSCPMASGEGAKKLDVVVVTGGHDFDHDPFFAMLRQCPRFNVTEAVQKDDSELFEDISAWNYDVIVLYNMTQSISPKRQANFITLLKDKGVGLVAMHHAMGAYQEWEQYRRITGTKYPLKPQEIDGVHFETGTYQHDVDLSVKVADSGHAITRGMKDFEIHDEVYNGCWFAKDNHVLLTVDHPLNNKLVAWTRTFGKARVFTIQLGHDAKAYANPNLGRLISRGICWSAGELK
ncbi:MAG: ThuA domain-containing protein [Sedimentisphaerales bacterium]|nr:ThuA domain-containing protein [Sedimentisphaerales bacterium]